MCRLSMSYFLLATSVYFVVLNLITYIQLEKSLHYKTTVSSWQWRHRDLHACSVSVYIFCSCRFSIIHGFDEESRKLLVDAIANFNQVVQS